MERIFDIAFRINGELASSFGSAISEAQRQMRDLTRQISAGTQRNLSQTARAAQNLERLYSAKNAINQYKQLNQNVRENSAALMQARLRTAQLRAEHQREIQQTERMQQAYDRLKAVYQENRGSMSVDDRVAMQAQLRAAQQELQEQRRRESAAGSAATGSNRESETLTRRLQQQQQQLAALRSSLQSAGVDLSAMAAHEHELEEAIARTTQELERQQQLEAIRQRHSQASQNFSYAYGNFQNSISTAQSIMAPFTDAVKVSMDFNKAMSEVKAITASTGAEFDMLKAKAKELGASTMFSASDVAQGMKELGKSGFNAEQIDASIASNLNLAAAGELDLATSSKILSDALTMFKVPMQDYAKESEHFADVMAKSANSSNTSVELIGETMKYAGAVAGSMGYSFNDAAIATTLMAKVGLNGSMAGTALRSTFTRLVSPPKDAAAALETLGVSAVNADGTLKPFRETLGELRTAFSKLSESDKATFAKDIAGLEAMSGFLAMVDADEKTYQETVSAIDNAQGAALQTAKEKTDNLAGAITTFQSAFEGLQIAVGDAFEEPLKNLVNSVAESLGAFTQWVGKHQELAQAAGVAAAAISGVIVAVAGYSVVSTGIEYLAASYQLLKMRVLESAAAMRASATASSWSAIGAGISGAFTSLTAKIAAARAAVVSFFATAAATNGASIVTSITNIGSAFLNAAKGAMALAFSPVGVALMALAAAGYYVYTHWSQVAPVFQNLASVIGGALSTAIQTLGPALESLSNSTSRLGPAFAQIGQVAFTAFALVANVVVRVAALIITSFANAIKTVVELFSGLGNAIASFLAGDFSKAGEHLSGTLSKTVENVKKTFSDGFKNAVDIGQNLTKPIEIIHRQEAVEARQAQETQARNSDIVSALSTAIESAQKQNSDADLSKISDAIKATVDAVKQDPKTDITPQLQAISTAIESVKKENPNADTSKLESVLSAAMSQIQAAQKDQSNSAEIVKSVSTAIESLKAQNSEADFSKIEAAISAAVEKTDSSENLAQAISTAIESTKQEQPELDLTPIVEAISTAQAQQVEQKNLEIEPLQSAVTMTADSMNQFAPTMQMAAEGVNQMTAGQQMFNAEVQTSQGTIAATNAQVQASQGALASFNGALQSTNGGLSALASSSSSAASSISGLASAASSAISALQSAAANAANVGKPAQNFRGGIYNKGAFLTTFAEKSPEAAIPIDNSQRAIDLWTKTGQMLGQLPGNSTAIESAPTTQKMTTLERAQKRRLEQVKAQYEAAKKADKIHSTQVEYDELGNIKGLNGLKDNIITVNDDISVQRAKKSAQMQEWQARQVNSTAIESSRQKIPRSIFSGRVQTPNIPMTQTQPRNYDTDLNIGNILGGLNLGGDGGGILSTITERISAGSGDGIIPQLINNLPQQSESSPIDLHFEINIQGNANAEDVEQGIKQSIPILEETFERKLANHQHELQRRSF